MAKRKNWQYTRNGVEYTLSVGGLMKFIRGDGEDHWRQRGWLDPLEDHWRWEWEEDQRDVIVTILGFSYAGCPYKRGCWVKYFFNGKFGSAVIKAPGEDWFAAENYQHLDE